MLPHSQKTGDLVAHRLEQPPDLAVAPFGQLDDEVRFSSGAALAKAEDRDAREADRSRVIFANFAQHLFAIRSGK